MKQHSLLPDLDTPALVLDLDTLDANIETMQSFFRGRKARLRPHFKTHKCPPIAHKQLSAGAKGITCAKVGEAEVLVQSGVKDILIANQIIGPLKISRLAGLLRHSNITVAVDDPANVRSLSRAASRAGATLGIYVEVDIGMGRCGVRPGKPAVDLARLVSKSPGLEFRGLQGYEGHLVMLAPGPEKARRVREALDLLSKTKSAIERAGLECREVSGGGTGSCNLTGLHPVMTEIQAGSYATMDAKYSRLVPEFRCALFCLATIISRPRRGVAIADAGMKALSPEFGMPEVLSPLGAAVAGLSEEHTNLTVSGRAESLRPGDRILLIPSHGCTTFNLHDKLYGLRHGAVECRWDIAARGRFA